MGGVWEKQEGGGEMKVLWLDCNPRRRKAYFTERFLERPNHKRPIIEKITHAEFEQAFIYLF